MPRSARSTSEWFAGEALVAEVVQGNSLESIKERGEDEGERGWLAVAGRCTRRAHCWLRGAPVGRARSGIRSGMRACGQPLLANLRELGLGLRACEAPGPLAEAWLQRRARRRSPSCSSNDCNDCKHAQRLQTCELALPQTCVRVAGVLAARRVPPHPRVGAWRRAGRRLLLALGSCCSGQT